MATAAMQKTSAAPVVKRACGNCGGHATCNHLVQEIDNPLYDKTLNPHVPKKVTIRGLGTWRCANGCKSRLVKVQRPSFSGKEGEVGRGSDMVRMHGLELRTENVKEVLVRRPIPVVLA